MVLYAGNMLTGTRIFSSDSVWRQILAELNAEIVDTPADADVDFDAIAPVAPVSAVKLKSIILNAADSDAVVRRICGDGVSLPASLARVVVALDKTGGCRVNDLKVALGYSRDAATHAIEAAIYQLRRQFGRDFIQNIDGVYRLGKL